LYDLNKSRGIFASSAIFLDCWNELHIHKSKNKIIADKFVDMVGFKYFTGHVQAPTSSVRKWSEETSHPFITNNWMVIHNGVLTNYKQLNQQYCKKNTNPVDTSTIVEMLEKQKGDEVSAIKKTISKLEGTFALLIINKHSKSFYITRQGSTLFFDDNGSFSSTKTGNMVEVPEGRIYKIEVNQFIKVGDFESNSPFLIL